MIDNSSEKIKEFIRFSLNRKITDLYKVFLTIIDDLKNNEQFINDNTQKSVRKKVLDAGNNVLRDLDEIFESLEINLKAKDENVENTK